MLKIYAAILTGLVALLSALVFFTLSPTHYFQQNTSDRASNFDGGKTSISCLEGARSALEIVKSENMMGTGKPFFLELINIYEISSVSGNRSCSANLKLEFREKEVYQYYNVLFDLIYLEDKKYYSVRVHPIDTGKVVFKDPK